MRSCRLTLLAPLALLAACGGGAPRSGAGAVSAPCPSVDEAKQAVENLERKLDVQPASSGFYVADVRNFQFSEVTFGAPTTLEVKAGAVAQGVCPARLNYTYDSISGAGQADHKAFGSDRTFYFFKDDFGGWSVEWSRQ